jgi:hypothetical protein
MEGAARVVAVAAGSAPPAPHRRLLEGHLARRAWLDTAMTGAGPKKGDYRLTCFGPPRRMEEGRERSIIAAAAVIGRVTSPE